MSLQNILASSLRKGGGGDVMGNVKLPDIHRATAALFFACIKMRDCRTILLSLWKHVIIVPLTAAAAGSLSLRLSQRGT